MTDTEVDLEKILQVAQEAARLAGTIIRRSSSSKGGRRLETKSSSTDLVTETDQKCEALIIQTIRNHFPDHAIIGEESSGSDKYELSNLPTWTIDPIDGTTNFVHSLQLSCVLISFLLNQTVKVAVTYDPYADEMFYAVQGRGAFLEKTEHEHDGTTISTTTTEKLSVSNTTCLKEAVISMDPGYGRGKDQVERFCSLQSAILQQGVVRNIRVIGATGLNMAYVAAGRLDAGLEQGSWQSSPSLGPKIWDFAPGKLLIEEAGGVTRDLELLDEDDALLLTKSNNSSLDLLKRSFFCAATPELAKELLAIVHANNQKFK